MTSALKPIRTEAEYDDALARIEEVWDAAPGSVEADELEVLAILVEAYEKDAHPIPPPDPIDAVRFAMDQRGLKPKDLQPMLGPSGRVSEVLSKKRALTLEMIRRLHDDLGVEPAVLIRPYDIHVRAAGRLSGKAKMVGGKKRALKAKATKVPARGHKASVKKRSKKRRSSSAAAN